MTSLSPCPSTRAWYCPGLHSFIAGLGRNGRLRSGPWPGSALAGWQIPARRAHAVRPRVRGDAVVERRLTCAIPPVLAEGEAAGTVDQMEHGGTLFLGDDLDSMAASRGTQVVARPDQLGRPTDRRAQCFPIEPSSIDAVITGAPSRPACCGASRCGLPSAAATLADQVLVDMAVRMTGARGPDLRRAAPQRQRDRVEQDVVESVSTPGGDMPLAIASDAISSAP